MHRARKVKRAQILLAQSGVSDEEIARSVGAKRPLLALRNSS